MIVLPLAYFSMSLDIESLTPLELEGLVYFFAITVSLKDTTFPGKNSGLLKRKMPVQGNTAS